MTGTITWPSVAFGPINLWVVPKMKYITHVAVQFKEVVHSLPKPNRHHNVIRMIAQENGVGIDGPHKEGFLDNYGTFHNRTSAMLIATSAGQLNRKAGDNHYQGPELFSEDLW